MGSRTFPTASYLRNTRRRLNRRIRRAAGVVGALRRGQTLRKTFVRGQAVWVLSPSGREILPRAALDAITSPSVVAVGDCLFPDATHSQTYRYAAEQED
jgi:hypothetical protein